MTADRDPQVGALLDLLEPAPPRPGFWEDLEDRLRSEPSPLVALTRVPGGAAARRAAVARRRRAVVGLAAAVAVVAALVGSLALRDDDRERSETVPMDDGSSTSTPGTTEATTQTTSGEDARIALDGADLWIEATQTGDDELAWELLGTQSREQLGSSSALAALPLQEEWAPYVDSPDRDVRAVALGDDLWMVVFTVESEADLVAPRVLVVHAPPASEYTIEAFFPGPALGLISVPSLDETALAPGDPVPIHLDAEASVLRVVLDGVVLDGSSEGSAWLERDADGAVVRVRPQPALEVGVHWIAVLQIVDGALAADARAFEVGPGDG